MAFRHAKCGIEGFSFFSKCSCPWFEVLGPFFPASCPNETSTLKLEQRWLFGFEGKITGDGKLSASGYFLFFWMLV